MRSRAARLTLGATAWMALGAAGFFLVNTERSATERGAALGTFDTRARQATSALADARAAEQAYVAPGQNSATWIPKVDALITEAAATVDHLHETAVSDAAKPSLIDASVAIAAFGNADKRVRDYLQAGDEFMASDVVFGEGVDAATRASRDIEAAGLGEHKAYDAVAGQTRQTEIYAAGSAVGLTALILAILAIAGGSRGDRAIDRSAPVASQTPSDVLSIAPVMTAAASSAAVPAPDEAMRTLQSAAEFCTEFGRMQNQRDLQTLLGQAARLLDATGLVVWLGDCSGADLRPVMAEGYSPQVLAMMRPVPRMADNAAASAYRSGSFQIVRSRPGVSLGAVAAPLLAPDGCIGALTAEIRNGGESSERIEALASILAAQLAGALASSSSTAADVPHPRIASA